jgi:hypothetical protein
MYDQFRKNKIYLLFSGFLNNRYPVERKPMATAAVSLSCSIKSIA